MLKELASLDEAQISWEGRLKLSNRAHLLFDFHRVIDGAQESRRGKNKIGTTKRGIGPCYSSKMTRNGVRVGQLLNFELFKQQYRTLLEALQTMYPESLRDYDGEEELTRYEGYRATLLPMIEDTIYEGNKRISDGKRVIAEGANAALLDFAFGTYPAVTSSSTTAGGISTGLGIAGGKIETIIGVVKAY